MTFETYALICILITAALTAAVRFLPFVLFRSSPPEKVLKFGALLPGAVMAMLVVYCLRQTSFGTLSGFLPQVCALALTVLLHKWKHNTLLSIAAGTAAYMILIRIL